MENMAMLAFADPQGWDILFASLALFALIMSMISLWIRRSPWIFGTLAVISLIFAYQSSRVGPMAWVPLGVLVGALLALERPIKTRAKDVLSLLVVAISVGLFLHIFPGFNNWKIADNINLGKDALSYNLWLNYDKPFVGLLLLGLRVPLIQKKEERKKFLKKALPLSALGIALLMGAALYFHSVRWDPKFPSLFFIWAVANLFLVVIPEEAFFRGFIQCELFQRLGGKGVLAGLCSLALSSLFFALCHIQALFHPLFFLLVFAAGMVYGAIYQITKAIEGSILCHFLLNLIHFLFFTYPLLYRT